MEHVLVALGTNERVASALRRYSRRDAAIVALEKNVVLQRRDLLGDLRKAVRERSAAQVARHMLRAEYLTGSKGLLT